MRSELGITKNMFLRWNGVGTGITNNFSMQTDGINQYARDTSNANLRFAYNSDFSISLWTRFDVESGAERIISTEDNNGTTFAGYAICKIGGRLCWVMQQNFSGGQRLEVRTNTVFPIDTFFHLVITWEGSVSFDASNLKIYVNGVDQTLQAPTDNNINANIVYSAPYHIGMLDGALQPYAGFNDEVSNYNKLLTPSDVSLIYNNGTPNNVSMLGFGDSLLSWWRMGDGDTPPTILDQIGSNDLTMINSPIFSSITPTNDI